MCSLQIYTAFLVDARHLNAWPFGGGGFVYKSPPDGPGLSAAVIFIVMISVNFSLDLFSPVGTCACASDASKEWWVIIIPSLLPVWAKCACASSLGDPCALSFHLELSLCSPCENVKFNCVRNEDLGIRIISGIEFSLRIAGEIGCEKERKRKFTRSHAYRSLINSLWVR